MLHVLSVLTVTSIGLLHSAFAAVDFGNCTFETDFCQWTPTGGDATRSWTLSSPDQLLYSHRFIPNITQGMVAAVIRFSDMKYSYHSLYLESVELTPSDGVCGIGFFYTNTLDLGEFSLYTNISGRLMKLKKFGSTYALSPDYWKREVIALSVKKPLRLIFEMKLSLNGNGEVGIDNVQFFPCKAVCDFESGYCGWINVNEVGYFPWTNQTGSTLSTGTGPSYDHTYGPSSTSGHYLYVEATDTNQAVSRRETAILRRNITFDDVCLLSFAYHMYGSNVGSLTVTVEDSNTTTVVWQESGSQGSKWLTASVVVGLYINSGANMLAITAQTSTHFSSDIAIDDVQLLPCPETGLCTFGEGLCGWRNDDENQAQLQWKIMKNKKLSSNILVASFSSSDIPDGDYAVLQSPSTFVGDGVCSLRLQCEASVTLNNSKMQLRLIDAVTAGQIVLADLLGLLHQKGRGKAQFVEVDVSNSSGVLVVYAEKANGEMGSISLHSLEFLSCRYTTFELEQQYITWQDASIRNTSSWSLQTAKQTQLDPHQSITSDHTYLQYRQLGHYMLHVSMVPQKPATLVATVSESNVCGIRFWLYVSEPMSHKLGIIATLPDGSPRQLYVSKNEQSFERIWQYREVATETDLFGSKVGLVSTRGGHVTTASLLAIDDIQLTECADFRPCTFERGLCGWLPSQAASQAATWIRWRGSSLQPSSNLTNDHTTQTPQGHYLYMTTETNTNTQHTAILQGIPLTSNVCGISFWYYIEGNASLTLTFHIENKSAIISTFSQDTPDSHSSNENSLWHFASALMPRTEAVVHFEFHAVSHDTTNAFTVALDDVTYIACSSDLYATVTPKATKMTSTVTPKATRMTLDLRSVAGDTTKRLKSTLDSNQTMTSIGTEASESFSGRVSTNEGPSVKVHSSGGSLSIGVIVGAVVGVGVLAALVIFAVLLSRKYCLRYSSTTVLQQNPAYNQVPLSVQKSSENAGVDNTAHLVHSPAYSPVSSTLASNNNELLEYDYVKPDIYKKYC
ncbi:MAM and LDL-receptor class A domain-containing protein 1-like isoform X3 [Corticium candelabrum]|uniref:MAM and LDL-receptor class A domain-containing protein 1-like isoform X3 n=1 Tax=Corticium candelabrum TaxID=121492 RepID=UPI002E26BA79|nr:MAM and LDL-receptor class A domain-containing protein 1-like isoform X3 [Corticium candelabrum]